MDFESSQKVFHSPYERERQLIHVVLVRPEQPGNIGSVARAMMNMGIKGNLYIIGCDLNLEGQASRLAKHAKPLLLSAKRYPALEALFQEKKVGLKIAATARTGSSSRPHPLCVDEAVPKALEKLAQREVEELFLVFGPESDGLTNEEVGLCDWVVKIRSSHEYRSLNLAQAVLVFCYEINRALLTPTLKGNLCNSSQRGRLIKHMLQVAELAGFILPEDPFKMRPRLEGILEQLPKHIPEAKTLHGLLDQVSRSIQRGEPDIRGRYLNRAFKEGIRERESESLNGK